MRLAISYFISGSEIQYSTSKKAKNIYSRPVSYDYSAYKWIGLYIMNYFSLKLNVNYSLDVMIEYAVSFSIASSLIIRWDHSHVSNI